MVVPKRLTKLYKKFFKINNVLSKVDLLSFGGWWKYWTDPLGKSRNVSEKFHLFVDEWQLIWDHGEYIFDALDGLSQDESCYFWITYDHKQWTSKVLSECWFVIKNLVNRVGFCLHSNALYHAASLKTNMRSTVQVYSYWDRASRHNWSSNWSFYEPKCSFPFCKYWSYGFYLGHHICGPSVSENPHADQCLCYMLQVIKHEIKSWAKDGEVYTFHKVAILLTRGLERFRKSLGNALWREGILVCKAGSNYNRVVVDDGELGHSYEWPVVIAICTRQYSELNCLMFSRAVTRLVVLYVD